ncbi:MAG: hypothetical protein KME08_16950 [Aphanothece sp. CMT-3BRIN-NPC111]|jgi:hypothetical protein|nr:hypothetical protein [Aphanothece sp. CMT-3BRIN-NPC111]
MTPLETPGLDCAALLGKLYARKTFYSLPQPFIELDGSCRLLRCLRVEQQGVKLSNTTPL